MFSYKPFDGAGASVHACTLTITINGSNDAPVCADDANSMTEDGTSVGGNVLTNDTDVDVEPLSVFAPGTYGGAYGTLVVNSDGSYTYTLNNASVQYLDDGESVTDSFSYQPTDGTAASAEACTLTITINGRNDAPTISDAPDVVICEGETATNAGTFGDVDVEPVTFSVTGGGTVTQLLSTWSWSAAGLEAGDYSITITADDEDLTADTTFDVHVGNVAPAVTSIDISAGPYLVGVTSVTASGTWTDPGIPGSETYAGTINWGDGSLPEAITVNENGTYSSGGHVFAAAGLFVITVNITDSNGPADPLCPTPREIKTAPVDVINPSVISGVKFYDANGNGVNDDNAVVAGWSIYLDNDNNFLNGTLTSTTTGGDGTFSFINLATGTYFVYEAAGVNGWIQTKGGLAGNGSYQVTVPPGATTGIEFGNLREITGTGGKTLGFWGNKNGQTAIFDGGTAVPELAMLNSLNLVTSIGAARDFSETGTGTAGYAALQTWLKSANATNMGYMLSAQLAATALSEEASLALNSNTYVNSKNILDGFYGQINAALNTFYNTVGISYVNEFGNNAFISVGNLMKAADLTLGVDGHTPSGDVLRSYQEALKNALDAINNNQLLFVA